MRPEPTSDGSRADWASSEADSLAAPAQGRAESQEREGCELACEAVDTGPLLEAREARRQLHQGLVAVASWEWKRRESRHRDDGAD